MIGVSDERGLHQASQLPRAHARCRPHSADATVQAGKTLDDSAWNAAGDGGYYDLDVYSTNGFVWTFKGSIADIPVEHQLHCSEKH
jgi:hypothetical protein